jgi:hypothetical protein
MKNDNLYISNNQSYSLAKWVKLGHDIDWDNLLTNVNTDHFRKSAVGLVANTLDCIFCDNRNPIFRTLDLIANPLERDLNRFLSVLSKPAMSLNQVDFRPVLTFTCPNKTSFKFDCNSESKVEIAIAKFRIAKYLDTLGKPTVILTTKNDVDYYFPLEKYHTFSEFFTHDVANHEIRIFWEEAQIWFTCTDPEKSRMLRDYDCYTIYSKEPKLDIEFVNREISVRTRHKKHPALLPRPKLVRSIESFGPIAISALDNLKYRIQSNAIKTCIYIHGQENTGKTSLMRTLTSYLQDSNYLHLDLCAENISNFKIPKGVSKLVVTCDNAESVGASRSSEQGKNGLTEQMLTILDSTRFESFKDQESILESIVIILVSREITNLDVAMKRSQRVEIPIHLTSVYDSI